MSSGHSSVRATYMLKTTGPSTALPIMTSGSSTYFVRPDKKAKLHPCAVASWNDWEQLPGRHRSACNHDMMLTLKSDN